MALRALDQEAANEIKNADNKGLRALKKQYESLQVEIDAKEKEPDTPHFELDSFMRTETLKALEAKRQELEKTVREAAEMKFPYLVFNKLSENPRVMIMQISELLGPEPAEMKKTQYVNARGYVTQ